MQYSCPGAGSAAGPICFRELPYAYIHHLCNGPNQQGKRAFCGLDLETLCLPSDFYNIGRENCKRLVEVNLMTDITAASYIHLRLRLLRGHDYICLPPRSTQIGKELSSAALRSRRWSFRPSSRKSASAHFVGASS